MKIKSSGFTLIELILALAVFAVLSAALAAVLRTGLSLWRRVEEGTRAYQQARSAFSILARDLRNTVPFPGGSFYGTRDSLRFYARGRDEQNQGARIYRLDYGLSTSENGEKFLTRDRRPMFFGETPPAARENVTLVPTEMTFMFAYAPSGNENSPLWEDVWIDSGSFPSGIKAAAVLKDPRTGETENFETIFEIPTGRLPAWKK